MSTTPHGFETLVAESSAARCLSLIERCAPRLLRIGTAHESLRPTTRLKRGDMTEREKAEIRALRAGGMNHYDIAARTGWAPSTICRVCHATKP